MIKNIIEQLKSTSSTNKKLEILENNSDNELLKKIFYLTYSTDINFWNSKIIPSTTYDTDSIDLETAVEMLKVVYDRTITGNAARDYLTDLHSRLSDPAEQSILCNIVERNMKCGVNETTINKVWDNLLFVPPYMRCSSFSVKKLSRIVFPCYSQVKSDGMYCNIIVLNDSVQYVSRNGKIKNFKLPTEAEQLLINLAKNHVLMGEAIAVDEKGKLMSRKESNGYLDSDNPDSERLRFFLWDCIPYESYLLGVQKKPYTERLKLVENIVSLNRSKNLYLTKTVECSNIDQVFAHFKQMVTMGEEGTVIKNKNAIWKDGTSTEQIKMKVEFDCDLEIVDTKEGKGKHKGKLGAVVCASSDNKLMVSVGSGFTDAQRLLEYSKGDIITVKSNAVISKASSDTKSLFLPIFIEKRSDKTEADSLERVLEQESAFVETIKNLVKLK